MVAFLCGCSTPATTYPEVRSETLDALQIVSDFVPEPKEILVTPEFEPYPCGEELALQTGRGAFYTGQWALFVQDGFDIPQFVREVPRLLGEDWRVEELGIPVNFAEVYLVRDSPRMTLKVEESTIDGRKAIDLLAISRCGAMSDEERSATFPPPTPRPAL
ncbi:hypothetical protein FHS07_002339 [Microbacterium proteolyticum]|uniref:Uncharacterized protein n=1 Tax=Microbacterium proteolyticum TaxID=1572644 RepID=A0A7W5CJ50_9MICO|nr:hypothetical protein [Microbacterium proteolyticum]MBB3158643.1 hypothetical protein [Microbacterium proteolyticum]